jgi:hypothetical protein
LKAKIIEEKSQIIKFMEEFCEGFYELFHIILKNPIDNTLIECTSLIIQYFQLFILVFDDTVRNIY